jgi:hypothetical protein
LLRPTGAQVTEPVDEAQNRRDVDRLVKGAQAAAKASGKAKTTAQR